MNSGKNNLEAQFRKSTVILSVTMVGREASPVPFLLIGNSRCTPMQQTYSPIFYISSYLGRSMT
jgi:hypothetical protein